MEESIYHSKPDVFVPLGNGKYYYNFNIHEVDTNNQWDYIQVKLTGTPNYSDCVLGVIRSKYTEYDMLELINDYNSELFGINTGGKKKYEEFLTWVAWVKSEVKKDFHIK